MWTDMFIWKNTLANIKHALKKNATWEYKFEAYFLFKEYQILAQTVDTITAWFIGKGVKTEISKWIWKRFWI